MSRHFVVTPLTDPPYWPAAMIYRGDIASAVTDDTTSARLPRYRAPGAAQHEFISAFTRVFDALCECCDADPGHEPSQITEIV